MRKFIISSIGIFILVVAYLGKERMANKEKPVRVEEKPSLPIVFTEEVKNGTTPIMISASGNLSAKDRVEIYSEVQGIFESSDQIFKSGIAFEKGTILLSINSDEHKANLRSQKSNLYNQIVSLLPDLKFDYPDSFTPWKEYITAFDIDQKLKPLPSPTTENEKLFIATKNIKTAWYTVKNLEERLSKYTIYAPYNGILVEANVNKGTLIRPAQKLGEFINPHVYELEIAVSTTNANMIVIGNTVTLSNVENTKQWKGKINRINSLIDPNTQTVQVYIRVTGKGLREGMFLEANLNAKKEINTYKVSRKLIIDNDKVFIVNDDKLEYHEVEIVHYTKKEAIIRGLSDGTVILSRMLPGAYDGMPIQVYEHD